MKRFIGIMMVMVVVLFTGCGNSNTISKVDNLVETSEDFYNSKISENDDFYNSILLEKEKTFTWTENSQSYSCSIFGYSEFTQECIYWVKDLSGSNDIVFYDALRGCHHKLCDFIYDCDYDCLILRKEKVCYIDEFENSHILNNTYIVSLIQDGDYGATFNDFALNIDGEDKIALPVAKDRYRNIYTVDYQLLIKNGLIEKNKHYTIS